MSSAYGPTDIPKKERKTVDDGQQTTVAPPARSEPDGRPDVSDRDARERLERDRHSVVDREKEKFGGIKVGSAFFGWLTATGTVVLLSALLAAVGAVVGFATDTDAGQAATEASGAAETVGIAGGIVLLVVLFVAYYCGGYVAGRMARFNGAKQGLAVWLWALVIAIVVAILGAVAGARFDIADQLAGLPPIPTGGSDMTVVGIITVLAVIAASLGGAMLGGLAGMRFHRNVDKAGLGA